MYIALGLIFWGVGNDGRSFNILHALRLLGMKNVRLFNYIYLWLSCRCSRNGLESHQASSLQPSQSYGVFGDGTTSAGALRAPVSNQRRWLLKYTVVATGK